MALVFALTAYSLGRQRDQRIKQRIAVCKQEDWEGWEVSRGQITESTRTHANGTVGERKLCQHRAPHLGWGGARTGCCGSLVVSTLRVPGSWRL